MSTDLTGITNDLRSLIANGKKFNAILANIPWRTSAEKFGGLASLAALPIAQVAAAEAYVFVWTPPNYLVEAMNLMISWGFPRTQGGGLWIKKETFAYAPKPIRLVPKHELFVIGMQPYMRIKPEYEEGFGIEGDNPMEVRKMVMDVATGPYLEIFGHRPAPPNWTICGDQVRLFGASLYVTSKL